MAVDDLKVDLSFKNAVLYRALVAHYADEAKRIQAGPMLPLIFVAARSIGIRKEALSALLNLKQSPYASGDGSPTPTAEKIAEALGFSIQELFPASLYSGRFARAASIDADSAVFLPLNTAKQLPAPDVELIEERGIDIDEVLKTLSPREEKIMRLYFGLDGPEHTDLEISEIIGVCKARISQIRQKALRKLRHPSRSLRLGQYV